MRAIRILPIALTVLVAACATQTAYMPADERGDYGYTETRLTENRYRVTFTGNSLTPRESVQDYALLRAAELTLENGYDWFRPVTREMDKKSRDTGGNSASVGVARHHPRTYRRCGLLSCDTVTTHDTHVSGTVGTTRARDSYASSIEIVFGENPVPEDMDAYDARDLADTLRRRMDTPGR